jgi:hypothetical protein
MTGVGTSVIELIRTELDPHPEVEVWGVSITAGERWRPVRPRELNCSKVAVVGALAAVLHSGRFRVCRDAADRPISGADLLEKELAAFKVRQSKLSDAELYGAEAGRHDDCVLCISLPIWAGSLPHLQMGEPGPPRHANDPPSEWVAGTAEEKAVRQEELDAVLREQGVETTAMRDRLEAKYAERARAAFDDPDNPLYWSAVE